MTRSVILSDGRRPIIRSPSSADQLANGLVVGTIIVAALYFGQPVFVPLAIAIILALILRPIIRALRRIYIPPIAAIPMTVLMSALLIVGATLLLGAELQTIADDIPHFERTLTDKMKSFKEFSSKSGWIGRLSNQLMQIQNQLEGNSKSNMQTSPSILEPNVETQPITPGQVGQVILKDPPNSIFSLLTT